MATSCSGATPTQHEPAMSGSPSSRSRPSPFSFTNSIQGTTSRQQVAQPSTSHPNPATAKPQKSSMQNLMQRTEEALSKQSNYKGQRDATAAAQAEGGRGSSGGGGGSEGLMPSLMAMLGGLGNSLPDMGPMPAGLGGVGTADPAEMLLSLILNKDSLYGPMKVSFRLSCYFQAGKKEWEKLCTLSLHSGKHMFGFCRTKAGQEAGWMKGFYLKSC